MVTQHKMQVIMIHLHFLFLRKGECSQISADGALLYLLQRPIRYIM
jgi:hypothetical protein